MSFRGRYRAEAETTNGPKAWRRTRSIPAPLIDLIGKSEEPDLNEVVFPSENIYERNVCVVVLLLLLLLGCLVYIHPCYLWR